MFSSDPVVTVTDATIFQEEKAILSNISFSIEKGEFLFLVGKTGGGKTSLLKTLYADLPLQHGYIQVAGFDVKGIARKKIPLLRRKLGIVFQDFQLFPDRSVADNLAFVLKATGWKDKSKMTARLTEVLMRVGLGSHHAKLPHQLSGGEQQRVVIARALLNEPQILIADEPTGNLDPEISVGIFKLFLEINKSGTAVLMATHDHSLVKQFPARTLKCADGNMEEINASELV